MPRTVTLRLPDEEYRRFARCASAERRSIANLIETAALRYLDESLLVDDVEMDEILRDRKLVTKLRRGSAQAKKRQGRFVE